MQSKNFSIGRALDFATETMSSWHTLVPILVVQLISVVVALPLIFLTRHTRTPAEMKQLLYDHYVVLILYALFMFVLSWVTTAWVSRMGLDVYDSGKTSLQDSSAAIQGLLPAYMVLGCALLAIILGGFLLFVVPGIIFMMAFAFASLVMIDKKVGVKKALRESWRLTSGIKMKFFGCLVLYGMAVGIAQSLLNFLLADYGTVKILIDMIVRALLGGFSLMAMVAVYRELQKQRAE